MITSDYTMVTTCDTDIHLIKEPVDVTRMKCARVKWIVTIDGRYVNTASVVSLWEPTEEQAQGFLEDM